MNKRCFKCLCDKPLEQFYRNAMMRDGHLNKCKECAKLDDAAYRGAHAEQVRAYDRKRRTLPHRVALKREYAQTPEGRACHARAMEASALRYPERNAARTTFHNAVRDGKVIPWPICAVPDCHKSPQGHHPDYSRPLDVVWLCYGHHLAAHEASKAGPL